MNINDLRKLAITNSLFKPVSLKQAFQKLKFVQADPIRSPARAQDLILRHRVNGYKNGDLEKNYSKLNIEEDFLYAHGFIQSEVWQLLHPRDKVRLKKFDQKVLELISEKNEVDPKELVNYFGNKRERNWWGGKSQATRMSLERLHYYGLVRISGRRNGVRIYHAYTPNPSPLSKPKRLEKLIYTIIEILSPVTYFTLKQSLHRLRRHFGPTRSAIKNLIAQGLVRLDSIDGLEYLYPAEKKSQTYIPATVRFLTPFDPVVWDRRRFEHLWGWPYRFEAYTPKAKRLRGYYAMPLLWREQMIGWANALKTGKVEVGFVNGQPKTAEFKIELKAEIDRLNIFLKTDKTKMSE